MPHHSGSEHVKLVLGAYNCCIFRLFVWTYAIKGLLLFSSFVDLSISEGSFIPDYLEVITTVFEPCGLG